MEPTTGNIGRTPPEAEGWTVGARPATSVRVNVDDTTMDRIIDELTERAGLQRGTDALGLARWDMKAVLLKHGYAYGSDR